MNSNNYQKVVHAALWNNGKILLSKRLKEGYHKGYWQNIAGKMEDGELPVDAIVRETLEETGLNINPESFIFVDCFIYSKRRIKTFLFERELLPEHHVKYIKNPEPHKQTDWQWFTVPEALKLKLLPSLEYYLKNL